jgi:hypothetical protein
MPDFKQRAIAFARRIWPHASDSTLSDYEFGHLVGQTTDAIVNRRDEALRELFLRIDSPAPTIEWDPPAHLLDRHPELGFLQRFWDDRRCGAGLPPSETIEPMELAPALGYVMLLQPVDGGQDYLYRVYGTAIAEHSGLEMTGKRVRDVPAPLVALYFLATYRAVSAARRPLYAHHATHHDIQVAQWDRLILPFVNPAGQVDRLLVGNVPRIRQ